MHEKVTQWKQKGSNPRNENDFHGRNFSQLKNCFTFVCEPSHTFTPHISHLTSPMQHYIDISISTTWIKSKNSPDIEQLKNSKFKRIQTTDNRQQTTDNSFIRYTNSFTGEQNKNKMSGGMSDRTGVDTLFAPVRTCIVLAHIIRCNPSNLFSSSWNWFTFHLRRLPFINSCSYQPRSFIPEQLGCCVQSDRISCGNWG